MQLKKRLVWIYLFSVLLLSGCFALQHASSRYYFIRNDEDSNVSLFFRHLGDEPRAVQFQITIDNKEILLARVIRNKQMIYCANIKLRDGSHYLRAKLVDIEIEEEKRFDVIDGEVCLLLEYTNFDGNEPILKIKELDHKPGFA